MLAIGSGPAQAMVEEIGRLTEASRPSTGTVKDGQPSQKVPRPHEQSVPNRPI
jgi:hypothetical protein